VEKMALVDAIKKHGTGTHSRAIEPMMYTNGRL